MSNSFIKTIIKGKSMDKSVDKTKALKGKVGLIIDIFSNDLHNYSESFILDLLEGNAYEKNDQVKVKLIRHHQANDEKARTEVQIFSLFKEMHEWWQEIDYLEEDEKKIT